MTELLTAAQMCAIEKAAIKSGAVTGLELMERAGRGVVAAVFEEWPELAAAPHRAVVLCGPGNNGGDGFVVARLLKEWGWEVEVFLYGDPVKLPPDARVNHERWRALGAVRDWDDDAIEDTLDEARQALVVDALFGTGLTRPMPKDTERTWHGFVPRVFSECPADRPKYVAVDMPSGLCSDSGRNLDGALPTDLTVSFHRAKVGHYLSPEGPPQGGSLWCGKVVVKDIGLGPGFVAGAVRLAGPVGSALAKFSTKHKYGHGHALVLSGGPGKGGAGRLAARGALRIGAGLVTVVCPPAALQENAARLDAVMLRSVRDGDGLNGILEDDRINVVCLGPGLGLDARAAALVKCALLPQADSPDAGRAAPDRPPGRGLHPHPRSGAALRALVLDADALTLISEHTDLFARLHERCVLTPHAGEFARLFPDIAERLDAPATKGPAYSKVDATREAAARAGCVVLYKGSDTVIAAPDGRCALNSATYERAAPWLATAGAGDVLSGFIAGLLARGLSPMQAAEAAAWLHAECARTFGPGLIAEDLPEALPGVFRDLGL